MGDAAELREVVVVAVDHDPGLLVLGEPSKLSFAVAVHAPPGASRRTRFFGVVAAAVDVARRAGMFSVPPLDVRAWSWRTTLPAGAERGAVEVVDHGCRRRRRHRRPVPSGSNRIQSKSATGYVGAWSDSATGPICGFSNVASVRAGRPTGRNVLAVERVERGVSVGRRTTSRTQ